MNKYFYILLLAGICTSIYCEGQPTNKAVYSRGKRPTAEPSATRKLPPAPAKPSNPQGTIILTTNENCIVEIDSKGFDTLKAGSRKQILLPLGSHTLLAKNIATGDELLARLNVKNTTGTFRIDLKSLITIREKKRDSLDKITREKNELPKKETPVNDAKASIALATIHDLSINMVPISGGSFIMGVKGGKIKDLLPHTVSIKSLKMGKFEVTQQQWETIMGSSRNNSGNQGCRNCPVENVSWNDVDSFIVKINSLGKIKFRLPTEAEWEYVAKNAIEKEMEISGNASQMKVEDLVELTAWYEKNSRGKTHPAGIKKPLMGMYDLLGNVSEWCLDYYRPDYHKDNTSNPKGPATGSEKLIKGGSYLDTDDLKPAVRNKESPSTRKNTIGFRLVMETN